jgi:hypothetical protein
MADTIYAYNHTRQVLLHYGIENQAGNFYLKLLNDSAAFDATDTALTDVDNAGAYEVSGNGWDAGGEALTLSALTHTTNAVRLDCEDLSITASGGNIGPAHAAVLYLDVDAAGTTKLPLFYIDFETAETAVPGQPFVVSWSANGIVEWGPAA